MSVCVFFDNEIKNKSENEFYNFIDNGIALCGMAAHRALELPERQKRLVYLKAAEIREKIHNPV